MRQGWVYFNEGQAGILTEHDEGHYTFQYHESWIRDSRRPAISLTLPKQVEVYESPHLFSFFYNMLPEGTNKQTICASQRIDPDDTFGLLLASANYDTIGAVTLIPIKHHGP